MNLNKNQWHVKFYFWCADVFDAYFESYSNRQRSNLCSYVRTIFVWMPMIIALQLTFYAFAFYVLFYFPATHFGGTVTGKFYGVVIAAVAAVLLVAKAKEWLDNEWQRRLHEQMMTTTDKSVTQKVQPTEAEQTPKKEGGPGFIEVVWTYLVASKRKICPIIEFSNMQKEAV